MRFIHLADLHIGKTVNAFSMLEDQEFALSQTLDYAKQYKPDAVVIAGDVYDKLTPAPDAVLVFDRFITALAACGPAIMIISGNHDSPERLAFASGIMQNGGVYLYGVFDGGARVVKLTDGFGDVYFYMLPYIRPADVRGFIAADGAAIESYEDAFGAVISAARIDGGARNVLIAHQFFASGGADPERSESEREVIGGIDRIDTGVCGIATLFDYVALGHLHGPQRVGAEHVRYAGSLLKYSFSECFHKKCALLVDMYEKGNITVTALPINPLRDMRRIRGRLDDLLGADARAGGDAGDYLDVTLTDEGEVYDALGKLRTVYPNIMHLGFDNARVGAGDDLGDGAETEQRSPFSLFEEFYIAQNGVELSAEQRKAVTGFLNFE